VTPRWDLTCLYEKRRISAVIARLRGRCCRNSDRLGVRVRDCVGRQRAEAAERVEAANHCGEQIGDSAKAAEAAAQLTSGKEKKAVGSPAWSSVRTYAVQKVD
jgi:hypothetical protein